MIILSFCAQAVGYGVHEGRGAAGLMMMMLLMMTMIMITTIEVEWAALSPPKPNLSLLGANFKVEKIEKK